MNDHSIVLIGGPDSGKTNYLARLWEALRSQQGTLVAAGMPSDIKYVEEALAHLLRGSFAPRSEMSIEESDHSFTIPVAHADARDAAPIKIVVPDVKGELWQKAVETCELPSRWMENLTPASGAILFVRIGSDQNNEPLDWVTASELLSMPVLLEEERDERSIPTQVSLCELLRFLEHSLTRDSEGGVPRVAVMITAWDLLDAERAAEGPLAYLQAEYPMLAGRISDISTLDICVFGVSILGGDFRDEAFKKAFLEDDQPLSGHVVQDRNGGVEIQPDVTAPIGWLLQRLNNAT